MRRRRQARNILLAPRARPRAFITVFSSLTLYIAILMPRGHGYSGNFVKIKNLFLHEVSQVSPLCTPSRLRLKFTFSHSSF